MTVEEYDALEEYAERYARHKGEYQEIHINIVKKAYMDGYMRGQRVGEQKGMLISMQNEIDKEFQNFRRRTNDIKKA